MKYIHRLSIKNFKVFKEKQDINFAPITILTGANNTGKSSIRHALDFLHLTITSKLYNKKNIYTGKNVLFNLFSEISFLDLKDEFANIKNQNSDKNSFEIQVPILIESYPNELCLEIEYIAIDSLQVNYQIKKLKIVDKNLKSTLINFEVYKHDAKNCELFVTLNYIEFYKQYLHEKASYKLLEKYGNIILDDNNNKEDIQGIIDKYKEISKNFFGDILTPYHEIDFGATENKEKIIFPDVESKRGIFLNEEDYLNKKKRNIDDLPRTKNDGSITTLEVENYQTTDTFLDIYNKHEDLNVHENLNYFIFEELSQIKFKYKLEFNVDSFFSYLPGEAYKTIDNPSQFIYDIIKNHSLNIKEEPNKFRFGGNETLKDSLLNDFGKRFINDYILERINKSMQLFEKPSFFGYENINIKQRYFDIYNTNFKFLLDFYSCENDIIKNFIKKWFANFELGEDISIKKHENVISLYIIKNKKETNIVEHGYGVSKIVPILFYIINQALSENNFNKIEFDPCCLILEEPETGLHPKFQSLMAELIMDAYKTFNIQFIIETHSEYFIRKLQVLTAQQKIKPDETSIQYFNSSIDKAKSNEQGFQINIMDDGTLTRNFGSGFFDESSNLNIALYMKTKSTNN